MTDTRYEVRWKELEDEDAEIFTSVHANMTKARQKAIQMSKRYGFSQAAEIYAQRDGTEAIGKNFAYENGTSVKLEKVGPTPKKIKKPAKKKVARATPTARTPAKKTKPGTTKPKKAKSKPSTPKSKDIDPKSVDPVCAEWGTRKGSLVDIMLRMFLDNLGKPVALVDLSKKLYGNKKVSDHNIKLSMGLKNMVWRLHIKGLPYQLTKAKENFRCDSVQYTLSAI